MAPKAPDNFAQIFPEHPHRRVHILISILAFVLVAGSITVYQINKTRQNTPVQVYDEKVPIIEYSDAYWQQVTEDARALASSSAPISDEQWDKATEEARKLENQQNTN